MFDGLEPMPEIVADLMAAKAYLLEHGWCQGCLQSREGSVCIIGAVYGGVPGGRQIGAIAAGRKARAILALGAAVGRMDIAGWNDSGWRKESEVLAAFDLAIAVELKRIER
jgi:hypothetical protein